MSMTDDQPVMVDPIRRNHWIHDGHDRHFQSVARGQLLDNAALQRSIRWHNADQGPPTFFLPTLSGQFPARPTDPGCPGFQSYWRSNRLPVISQQIYDNELLNKSVGVIEHEQREASRFVASRLFDKSEGHWGFGGRRG